jgi:hypothetical protein
MTQLDESHDRGDRQRNSAPWQRVKRNRMAEECPEYRTGRRHGEKRKDRNPDSEQKRHDPPSAAGHEEERVKHAQHFEAGRGMFAPDRRRLKQRRLRVPQRCGKFLR